LLVVAAVVYKLFLLFVTSFCVFLKYFYFLLLLHTEICNLGLFYNTVLFFFGGFRKFENISKFESYFFFFALPQETKIVLFRFG